VTVRRRAGDAKVELAAVDKLDEAGRVVDVLVLGELLRKACHECQPIRNASLGQQRGTHRVAGVLADREAALDLLGTALGAGKAQEPVAGHRSLRFRACDDCESRSSWQSLSPARRLSEKGRDEEVRR
jgi:hypothetical protein